MSSSVSSSSSTTVPLVSTIEVAKSFGSYDSPLENALKWVRAEEEQRPNVDYVIVASEIAGKRDGQRSFRAYHAFEKNYFLPRQASGRWKHGYEIVRADHPCRLYCDVEFYRSESVNSDIYGPGLVSVLIDLLYVSLAREYGIRRDETRVVLKDASKATKFSNHLIMHLGHSDEIAFRDTAACGRFVQKVSEEYEKALSVPNLSDATLAPKSIVDLSIYSYNHAMRLLNSSKMEEPQRKFRLVDGPPDGSLTAQHVADTLISVGRGRAKRLLGESDVTFAFSVSGLRKRSIRKSDPLSADVTEIIDAVPEISQTGIYNFALLPSRRQLCLDSECKDCPIAGRTHEHCTSFFIVNLPRKSWRRFCHHDVCSKQKIPWKQLPECCWLAVEKLDEEGLRLGAMEGPQ